MTQHKKTARLLVFGKKKPKAVDYQLVHLVCTSDKYQINTCTRAGIQTGNLLLWIQAKCVGSSVAAVFCQVPEAVHVCNDQVVRIIPMQQRGYISSCTDFEIKEKGLIKAI